MFECFNWELTQKSVNRATA